jgi:hypothetical protein
MQETEAGEFYKVCSLHQRILNCQTGKATKYDYAWSFLLVRKLTLGPNLDFRLSEQKRVGSELKTEFHIIGIH